MVPIVVESTTEEPLDMEPTPLSSTFDAYPVRYHYPRHLGLIPSAMEESTPIVPGARTMASIVPTTMSVPMAVPTATEAPILVPALQPLVDW